MASAPKVKRDFYQRRCPTTRALHMNRGRRKQALIRNIEMTQGALEHAQELLKRNDRSVTAFPKKTEKFISDMVRKLKDYQAEPRQLELAD